MFVGFFVDRFSSESTCKVRQRSMVTCRVYLVSIRQHIHGPALSSCRAHGNFRRLGKDIASAIRRNRTRCSSVRSCSNSISYNLSLESSAKFLVKTVQNGTVINVQIGIG